VVSPSQQCSSTPVGFGEGFLSKEQRDNTGASPVLFWPGFSWFLPVPSSEISTEGAKALSWCYQHHQECDERAEKARTKWLPGMFPVPLQSLAEVYSCTRGLFWRKCNLSDCTVLYSSKIKWSWEHFEATIYVNCILCVILIFQGETSNFEPKYNFKTCTRGW